MINSSLVLKISDPLSKHDVLFKRYPTVKQQISINSDDLNCKFASVDSTTLFVRPSSQLKHVAVTHFVCYLNVHILGLFTHSRLRVLHCFSFYNERPSTQPESESQDTHNSFFLINSYQFLMIHDQFLFIFSSIMLLLRQYFFLGSSSSLQSSFFLLLLLFTVSNKKRCLFVLFCFVVCLHIPFYNNTL